MEHMDRYDHRAYLAANRMNWASDFRTRAVLALTDDGIPHVNFATRSILRWQRLLSDRKS